MAGHARRRSGVRSEGSDRLGVSVVSGGSSDYAPTADAQPPAQGSSHKNGICTRRKASGVVSTLLLLAPPISFRFSLSTVACSASHMNHATDWQCSRHSDADAESIGVGSAFEAKLALVAAGAADRVASIGKDSPYATPRRVWPSLVVSRTLASPDWGGGTRYLRRLQCRCHCSPTKSGDVCCVGTSGGK